MFLGRWIDDRIRGMVGMRNCVFWCWKSERMKMFEMVEYSFRERCGLRKSRIVFGLIS